MERDRRRVGRWGSLALVDLVGGDASLSKKVAEGVEPYAARCQLVFDKCLVTDARADLLIVFQRVSVRRLSVFCCYE